MVTDTYQPAYQIIPNQLYKTPACNKVFITAVKSDKLEFVWADNFEEGYFILPYKLILIKDFNFIPQRFYTLANGDKAYLANFNSWRYKDATYTTLDLFKARLLREGEN